MSPAPRPLQLVVMDVDGTLTDGRLTLSASGGERKTFHAHDGGAIHLLRTLGIHVALVSGRDSEVTARRAAELNIDVVRQGAGDKARTLRDICAHFDVSLAETAYIGDDLGDIRALSIAGHSAAPANAVLEARQCADFVCTHRGGDGAVREAIEHFLRAADRWSEALEAVGAVRMPANTAGGPAA